MNKRTQILLIAIMTVILFTVVTFWFKHWLSIDECLDSGGRWNYEEGVCEYRESEQGK